MKGLYAVYDELKVFIYQRYYSYGVGCDEIGNWLDLSQGLCCEVLKMPFIPGTLTHAEFIRINEETIDKCNCVIIPIQDELDVDDDFYYIIELSKSKDKPIIFVTDYYSRAIHADVGRTVKWRKNEIVRTLIDLQKDIVKK